MINQNIKDWLIGMAKDAALKESQVWAVHLLHGAHDDYARGHDLSRKQIDQLKKMSLKQYKPIPLDMLPYAQDQLEIDEINRSQTISKPKLRNSMKEQTLPMSKVEELVQHIVDKERNLETELLELKIEMNAKIDAILDKLKG